MMPQPPGRRECGTQLMQKCKQTPMTRVTEQESGAKGYTRRRVLNESRDAVTYLHISVPTARSSKAIRA